MRPAFIALFLGALVFVSPPLAAKAGTTGSIAGRVTDLDSGAPIAGATIERRSPAEVRKTTTNVNGYYLVPSLPPSNYTVTVIRPGYETIAYAISVVQNQQAVANVQLRKLLEVISRDCFCPPNRGLVDSRETADQYSIHSNRPFYDNPATRQYLFNGIPGIITLGDGEARPF